MRSRNDRIIAFLMLLPSLILLAIFVYYFIFRTGYNSMTDWGNDQETALAVDVEREFVGLDNYETLLTSFLQFPFRDSLVNTFFFTLLFIGGCIAVGFGLAFLLDQKIVGEAFFRTTFLLPMSLSLVVTGTIWRWLLQPGGGINILPEILFGADRLDYRWMNSETTIWTFAWEDLPTVLTYIGLFILGLLAFNFLSRENDYLGRFSQMALRVIAAAFVGWLIVDIGFGSSNGLLVGAAAGIVSVVYEMSRINQTQDIVQFTQRNWRPLLYLSIPVVLLGLMSLLDIWEIFLPPLEIPSAEQDKGYKVALSGVIIAAIWQMSGYTMAMFLAGIRGIPEELREAARVDGCAEWQVYTTIILPLMRPITLSAMIILGHISLKIFDLIFVMAGPRNNNTVVPGILVYTEGFIQNRFAAASAIAVIMLVLVALVIVPYLWTSLREESS